MLRPAMLLRVLESPGEKSASAAFRLYLPLRQNL